MFSSSTDVNGRTSRGGSDPATAATVSTLVTVGEIRTPHVDGVLSADPITKGRASALTLGEAHRTILKPCK